VLSANEKDEKCTTNDNTFFDVFQCDECLHFFSMNCSNNA